MRTSPVLASIAVAAGMAGGALLAASAAYAQAGAVDVEPSVWDLTLGLHAAELPSEQFVDYACGTNGGPPSLPIGGWTDFASCRVEAQTGWHEVFFKYDDFYEYIALARNDAVRAALYGSTTVYSRPVIATALFDDDGFLRGIRLVTDPRVDLATREQAYTLGGFIQARYDGDWNCENLERGEGESAYRGVYIKKICTLVEADTGITRTIETHLYRREGQLIINPADNTPTTGYFESLARSEEFLLADIPDREARLAAVAALPPPPDHPDILRARDCPGCDLSGLDLRRANLAGANLAGADLSGAILHAATLTGANLAGANLSQANLNRALMMQVDLSGANLDNVMAYEARLDGANLSNITAPGFLAQMSRMIRADLSGAVITDSNLTGVRMTNATAVGANFARSRFWDAQMGRTDFTGAIFARGDLLNASMTDAMLAGADFRVTNLANTDFRGADLTDADFSQARMIGAVMAGATVAGASFTDAVLPGGFTPP